MYDPTIHSRTVGRHVRKSDFAKNYSLRDPVIFQQMIRRSVSIGLTGFTSISIRVNSVGGKSIYQQTDIAETLVARHITSNIKRVTRVKQDDRQFIVTCMKSMLSEGVSFRVYKFDIASFYESVDVKKVCKRLEDDIAFSGQSIRALRSLMEQLAIAGVSGLPRGMAISATLAEYLLRDFDNIVSNQSEVWFFARFVDDIVLITSGNEDGGAFRQRVEGWLPDELCFNKKTAILNFSAYKKTNTSAQENLFPFLGYQFSVGMSYRNNNLDKIQRNTWLDIAPSKVSKIKSRIARSLIDYSENGNFDLLLLRTRLLTSNFRFYDKSRDKVRTSGIYFNYPLICPDRSTALPSLDRYLLNVITSPHPKNRLRPAVNNGQRRELLNLSFYDGFKNKRFFHFTPTQLSALTACWTYA